MVKVKREPGPAAKTLEIALTGLDGAQGRVGFFESAKYPDGTPVAYVAAIHEYGVPEKNIPPRLGWRNLIAQKTPAYRLAAETGVRSILAGSTTIHQVMDGIGMMAAGDLIKRIGQVNSPPLKPATVIARAKKHSNFKGLKSWSIKPLVDSGVLFATPTHDVVRTK